jgi:CRP/FNR family transcriptional regulator, cyclic AMP receptor protein
MDREEGMRVLAQHGWLSATPVEFQQALLSRCRWKHLEAGDRITVGGEETGDLIGLARGTIEMTTVLGVSETPMMHLGYPVFWLGYGPRISGQPRRISANAKSPVWLASVPQATVMALLGERPEWWQHFLPLALAYGDVAINIAADMLIRGSERRCAAALLRLSGRRFPDQGDAAPVEIPLSQDELADAANLSRNTTGEVLRKLATRGLIELGYRCIIVHAPTALRAFVEQNHE